MISAAFAFAFSYAATALSSPDAFAFAAALSALRSFSGNASVLNSEEEAALVLDYLALLVRLPAIKIQFALLMRLPWRSRAARRSKSTSLSVGCRYLNLE